MSVTLEELQPFVGKPVIVHVIQDDNSLKETPGEIIMATVAGIPFKTKGGKGGVGLLTLDRIEEVTLAPVKDRPVIQKKIDLIEPGKMRQHLLDRHGVEFDWAKNANEAQAVEWHNSLDHSKLGHTHVDKKAEKAKSDKEREAAIQE